MRTDTHNVTDLDKGDVIERGVGIDEHKYVQLGDQRIVVLRVRPAREDNNGNKKSHRPNRVRIIFGVYHTGGANAIPVIFLVV